MDAGVRGPARARGMRSAWAEDAARQAGTMKAKSFSHMEGAPPAAGRGRIVEIRPGT